MSIFKKNPNETAYVGGKKHFTDVIKNTGDGDLLIWRQPEEDFNTHSTLIVMPGEQAVFVKGGEICKVFDSGTYKLTTQNFPFLSRLINAFSGGISAYNCVVYFVKSSITKELRWGTQSPIQVRDKVYNIRTEARARGSYKVRVINPTNFLKKLIGSNMPYRAQSELDAYFADQFQGKIKSAVSQYLNALQQELIGIDAYMDNIARELAPQINEIVNEYGLSCVNFSISGLDIDVSKYDEIDKSQLSSIAAIRKAQSDRGAMDILGEDWDKQQSAEILRDMANNSAIGGLGAVGAGLGMGVAAGGMFAGLSQNLAQTPSAQPVPASAQANGLHSGGEVGNNADPIEALSKLKKLADAGLITPEEYQAKKTEILNRL